MAIIHKHKDRAFRVLRSEKTSFPKLWELPPGEDSSFVTPGEFVGRDEFENARRQLTKITAENYEDQAAHALMRENTTSNDVNESHAVTVRKGHYEMRTQFYLPNKDYNIGDMLTLRYDPEKEGGVLGPTEASTKFIVGRVERPPLSGSTDMIEVTIFDNPVPTTNVALA